MSEYKFNLNENSRRKTTCPMVEQASPTNDPKIINFFDNNRNNDTELTKTDENSKVSFDVY